MAFRDVVRTIGKSTDRVTGLRAWLSGEPRPPMGGFDLEGEKHIDWGWICVNLPPAPKRALEIGSGKSPIIPAMQALGYNVTAVDLSTDITSVYSDITFYRGDFTKIAFENPFDIIVLCSVVEHIGLSGRFNSDEDAEGDLKAMKKACELLEPNGRLFLTIPVGIDTIQKPFHRIYGKNRLKALLDGFAVVDSRYLIKRPWGPWSLTDEEKALNFGPDNQRYALGEFILTTK
jgi:SAM-dependent methyltransferase